MFTSNRVGDRLAKQRKKAATMPVHVVPRMGNAQVGSEQLFDDVPSVRPTPSAVSTANGMVIGYFDTKNHHFYYI